MEVFSRLLSDTSERKRWALIINHIRIYKRVLNTQTNRVDKIMIQFCSQSDEKCALSKNICFSECIFVQTHLSGVQNTRFIVKVMTMITPTRIVYVQYRTWNRDVRGWNI